MPWNPFDWTAGPFLSLYVAIAAVVFLWGFSLRAMIGPTARATHPLSELELAYLAGGAHRLGDAILLSLTSANCATIDPGGHKITVTDQTPLKSLMSRPPLLPVQPNMTRQQFQRAVKPLVDQVQARLQAIGYYPTDEQMTSFRMTVLPFVVLLLAFGVIKAVVGAGTASPGRDSDLPPHRHSDRLRPAGEVSNADAGRQSRSRDLSGFPRASIARAARP